MADLPRESWPSTPVSAAAAPLSQVLTCSPHERLLDVAARLDRFPDRLAMVVDGDRVTGVLTASDVAAALHRADPLDQASPSGARTGGRGPRTRSAWGPARQP
jgi:hypothetical protein